MEYEILTLKADAPGKFELSSEPPEGKTFEQYTPRVYDSSVQPFGGTQPSSLTVDGDRRCFDIAFVTEQTYDGTLYFVTLAICAITQAAEQYIKENPGAYISSKVLVSSEYTRADMFYGKNVPVSHDVISILLARTDQGTHDERR